ncbi:S-layer protein [Methanoculleus taiwanensis]|uniref:S-layer protein n=2 Tax=Methanoculleus taiwanensis TaxID=1550565 RepID=A0A498H416_9EURY|nr:S-layer protein [Methanoculleus taiwanensis]
MMTRGLTLALILLLLAGMTAPALAADKYLYGSPTLSASIAGTNEFSPGQEIALAVALKNSGLNTFKFVDPTAVARDDLPNTAKLVTAALGADAAPVTVKTDPQFLGDIAGGKSATATFTVKVAEGAAPGTYSLPLTVTYTYLRSAEQYGSDSIQYFYEEKTEVLPLAVTITPDLRVEVLAVTTDDLNVGTEGYVHLTLKNAGYETAQGAVARIARSGTSPVVPTDAAAYLGDFAPGETVDVTFKAAVTTDAEAQTYPLDALVTYTDSDGDAATSKTVTLGIPVGGKTDFAVVSSGAVLYPGEKSVLEVVYKNTGAATVYNAQARISAIDPFTSNDDTAYLGDLAPGAEGTARFEMNVDADATLKAYGLDSEIRYRDALGSSRISDTMKVQVDLAQKTGSLVTNPVVLAAIAAIILGAGYYVFVMRRKADGQKGVM